MTDAPGEQRFVTAVSSRLQQLGALMRGGRNATEGGELLCSSGMVNVDSPEGPQIPVLTACVSRLGTIGEMALYRMYSALGMTRVGGQQELYKYVHYLDSDVLKTAAAGRDEVESTLLANGTCRSNHSGRDRMATCTVPCVSLSMPATAALAVNNSCQ